MFRRRPSALALLILAVAALIGPSAVQAFAPQSKVGKPIAPSVASNKPFNNVHAQEITTNTAIFAAKKPNKSGGGTEEEKKQVVDPLELFILFMTPWRNPNSIFLYMLIIINILGRMQESQ